MIHSYTWNYFRFLARSRNITLRFLEVLLYGQLGLQKLPYDNYYPFLIKFKTFSDILKIFSHSVIQVTIKCLIPFCCLQISWLHFFYFDFTSLRMCSFRYNRSFYPLHHRCCSSGNKLCLSSKEEIASIIYAVIIYHITSKKTLLVWDWVRYFFAGRGHFWISIVISFVTTSGIIVSGLHLLKCWENVSWMNVNL